MRSSARRAWRKLSGIATAALMISAFALPAKAVYTWEVLGGELEVTGFLQSEARLHFENDLYLNQWIQKLQVEATQTWRDVGIFDELAFTALMRPEFDVAYYYSGLTDKHVGRGATRSTYLGDPVRVGTGPADSNDPIGLYGLDGAFGTRLSTGGLVKNIDQGIWRPAELDNFEVLYEGQTEPILTTRDQRQLDCERCRDVHDSPTDVALNRTGSSGATYPFRELYTDMTIGDFWIRLGKQQIVWGKTDFFRLQDLINPVDFGSHFFFDSFEDIRIPQWILSAQYRPGSIGPFTDTAVQFIWNFDEFRAVGLGNPSGGWSHPFGKEKGTFALFNHFFTKEPCLGLGTLPAGGDLPDVALANGASIPVQSCFNGDGSRRFNVSPAGFGQPVGLAYGEKRPRWGFDATEIGIRLEGRLGKFRIALTDYWGWGDTPGFEFESINIPSTLLDLTGDLSDGFQPGPGVAAAIAQAGSCGVGNQNQLRCGGARADGLVAGLAETAGLVGALGTGATIPIHVTDPELGVQLISATEIASGLPASGPGAGPATQALNNNNAELLYSPLNSAAAPILGGGVSEVYDKNNTVGLAVDYFEDITGIVFRLESSWTNDELVVNTQKADWRDDTDVLRFSLGMDRPTFIKFLNPTRTFFVSAQIFHTYYLGWEGGPSSGMAFDRHNWIYTLFVQGQYLRDRLTPQGFLVWDQTSNGWISGFQAQYLFSNSWSATVGGNFTWGGQRQERHNFGPFTSFVLPSTGGFQRGAQKSTFGQAQRGASVFRENDEFFFRIRYQF